MTGEAVHLGPMLAVALVLLTAGAAVTVHQARIGNPREVLVAALRATVQLAAVSLVIAAVLRSAGWAALFVTGMVAIAAVTAGRRIVGAYTVQIVWALAPVLVGVLPCAVLVVLTGVVPWHPVSVLPVAGILIGGAMNATSVAGRREHEELHTRHGEYEAALSLGLDRRAATHLIGRPSAALALAPGLDQTRTVGLVTLPGAFVGALLGGAGAVQAGAVQLLVLIGLLQVQSLAVLLTSELIARGKLVPPPP